MPSATTGLTRAGWLRERFSAICASEASALWGLNPYMSPYSLYLLKRGLVEESEELAEWIEVGLELQPSITRLYEKRTGRKVVLEDPYGLVRSPTYPFMSATPDGMVKAADGFDGPGDLEVKNVIGFKADEWDGDLPLKVQIQATHQNICTGHKWASACALIGGNRLVWKDIRLNEEFAAAHIEKCRAFWQRVQDGDPPPIDAHPATSEALKRLHPDDNGETVKLQPEAIEWDQRIAEAEEHIGKWSDIKEEARNNLRAAIGPATFGLLPDGVVYSLKTSSVKAYAVKERTQRVLRRKDDK